MITMPEKIPKEHIGMIGLKHVAKKETAVATEATSIALEAFLNVKAICKGILFFRTLICLACSH